MPRARAGGLREELDASRNPTPHHRNLSPSQKPRCRRSVTELVPQEIRTFFVTTVTANRRCVFQTDANAQLMLSLLDEDRAKARYQLHAFVLMPDHLHLLLTPAPDVSIEKALQFIKGGFSFRMKSRMPVGRRASRCAASKTGAISAHIATTSMRTLYEHTSARSPKSFRSHPLTEISR